MPLPNNVTTRLPSGVNTDTTSSIFANYPIPRTASLIEYFNDFMTYTAGDWVVTETQAGATQALTAGSGGWLLLTNSAADNDLIALQKTPAMLDLSATKQAWFSCRFKVSDATQSDFVFGMQVVDTTPLDVTDGIYFLKKIKKLKPPIPTIYITGNSTPAVKQEALKAGAETLIVKSDSFLVQLRTAIDEINAPKKGFLSKIFGK